MTAHVEPAVPYVRMQSGLILPEPIARKTLRPRAMDFFAGAGGFSLGVIQSGYEVVAAVENDASAVMTYMVNLCRWGRVEIHYVEPKDKDRLNRFVEAEWKRGGAKGSLGTGSLAGSGWISHEPATVPGVSHIFFGDVRKLTPERILSGIGMKRGDLDLVVGGPPCQGYSTAGKRNVMDPRSSLLFDFARFIVGLRPKTMCMENVRGIQTMLTPDGVAVLDKFARILEDGEFGGYDAFQRVLQAHPSAVGLMRGKTPARRVRPEAPPKPSMPDTQDLFAEEAAV